MLDNLKKEMKSFLKDIDENIKDEKDLIYIKTRSSELLNAVMDEIDNLINYKEDRLNAIIKKQEQEGKLLKELQEKIDNVYEDIYEDAGDDFLISCPYCGFEFDADIDEDLDEITCPECGNIIELDWNGNPEDDEGPNCGGNCSHCNGCE